MANLSVLSVAMDTVFLNVSCSSMQGGTNTHIAKVGGDASLTATKVASVGVATVAKPCTYGGIGVNPKATGADAAIIVYGAVGAKSPGQGPMCLGASQSERKITTIPANGSAAKTIAVAGSPFGTSDPATVLLAPGKTANTWIGFAHMGTMSLSATAGMTISATGVVAKKTLTSPAVGSGFAAGAGALTPLLEVSSSKWLVSRVQTTSGMNGTTKTVALATFDPSKGTLVSGQALAVSGVSMTGPSSPAGAQILTPSSVVLKTKQYLYFYGLTAAGKFSIGQWWSLTNK